MKRAAFFFAVAACGSAAAPPPVAVPPTAAPPASATASPPVTAEPAPPKPKIDAFEVALGYSCALTEGKVACWDGANASWIDTLPPVDRMHAGFKFGCARAAADHALWCWGVDSNGQLGRGKATPSGSLPAAVVPGDDGKPRIVEDFATGDDFVCALSAGDAGLVHCWGRSVSGEAGVMAKHDPKGEWIPVLVPKLVFRGAKRLYGGTNTSCVVNAKEELWCWGDQDAGYNSHGATAVPQHIAVSGHVKAMSFGSGHSCLLQDDGAALCRGWNGGGQLGSAGTPQHALDGKGAHDTDFLAAFTKIPELSGSYVDIAASRHETCVVDAQHHMSCIGTFGNTRQQFAQLGSAGFGEVVKVAATMGRRCALDTAGVVRCIGENGHFGSDPADPTPVEVKLPQLISRPPG